MYLGMYIDIYIGMTIVYMSEAVKCMLGFRVIHGFQ